MTNAVLAQCTSMFVVVMRPQGLSGTEKMLVKRSSTIDKKAQEIISIKQYIV